MAKQAMDGLLKQRMSATRQASELQMTDKAYEKLFETAPPAANVRICAIPLEKLIPFFTADIGFKPYTQAQLEAFADQLKEEGLMVRIIVRPVAGTDTYEILAGHNRTSAARLAGWTVIPAEIVAADDARAVVIATSTNLIQRQNLSITERGKAYKALLAAKNRNGQRDAAKETFGDSRQRYNARALVANSSKNGISLLKKTEPCDIWERKDTSFSGSIFLLINPFAPIFSASLRYTGRSYPDRITIFCSGYWHSSCFANSKPSSDVMFFKFISISRMSGLLVSMKLFSRDISLMLSNDVICG